MNGKERAYWYTIIVEKQYGDFCKGCGKNCFHNPYTKLPQWTCKILYLDHIDNDPSNTIKENLQLLCPSCNRIKNPKREEPVPERPFTPEMAKNTKFEGPYRRWIMSEVLENGGIPFANAVDGGAERFGMSPETTRKWIRKMISDEGNYGFYDDSVVFKKDIPILEEAKSKKQEETDKRHDQLLNFSKKVD